MNSSVTENLKKFDRERKLTRRFSFLLISLGLILVLPILCSLADVFPTDYDYSGFLVTSFVFVVLGLMCYGTTYEP